MDETLLRVGLVSGALSVAAMAALIQRARAKDLARHAEAGRLAPGIYLFTSRSCADCGPARTMLAERLGDAGFREFAWESHPEIFDDMGIDAVPATVVVDPRSRATVYPGLPTGALGDVGP